MQDWVDNLIGKAIHQCQIKAIRSLDREAAWTSGALSDHRFTEEP